MTYQEPLFLLVFLPVVMLVYQLVPQKHRWKVLLAGSYVFFWSISGNLLVFLLLSTFSIHHFGLWLDAVRNDEDARIKAAEKPDRKALREVKKHRMRRVLALGIVLHVGLLLCLKYLNFFGTNVNLLFKALGWPEMVPTFHWLLPIGISFYTMQAVSYLVDVYRGTVPADRNLGRLALYMGFFPQLMEGPICRYSQTAESLFEGKPILYANLTSGTQRMLYGAFKKIVIADRLNLGVNTIFDKYPMHGGGVIFLGMLAYTCQLYMDFSGIMDMVMGMGEIFGIKLPENFRRPFFSKSISEFWTRWHITLGAWFRDYIYYPLSLSGPLKKLTAKGRKHLGNHFGPLMAGTIALFCVWFCNGLWHGSAWSYLFFGMYHFFFIVLANMTEPFTRKVLDFLHIPRESAGYRVFRIIRTALLVCVGELFFRANGLRAGLRMFRTMVTDFSIPTREQLQLGLDRYDVIILVAAVLIVFVVSLLQERNIKLRATIRKAPVPLRWAVYYAAILSIVIFGAYGVGYVPVEPMYAGF